MSLAVYHPQSSEAQRELEMPKKSYALRNRRGYMDSTFDEGLRIVLQWMELRRQRWERQVLTWRKELYMLTRLHKARGRDYNPDYTGTYLPANAAGPYIGPFYPPKRELDVILFSIQNANIGKGRAGAFAPGY